MREKMNQKQCIVCGCIFEADDHRQKYCSEACRKERKNEKQGLWYQLHKEKLLSSFKARREKLIQAGICTVCGKEKAMPGKRDCFSCALRRSEQYYRRKEQKAEETT